MAVCVGCGLEVNNGILEVNVCNDPVVANPTSLGGVVCDLDDEAGGAGCLKVVLNDTHAGCGLDASGGALVVDPCLNGGILCSTAATGDDADGNCILVNVQGQGTAACVALATARGADDNPFLSANSSPNCNGLIRTCDGLWAPPALSSINFSCGQDARGPGTIAAITQPLGLQAADVEANLDPFNSHDGDSVYATSAGRGIIVNAFESDPCNPINAMSWTAFNIGYTVRAGELWRWALWERICTNGGIDSCSNNPAPLTTGCNGCSWKLQAIQYIDRRAEGTDAFETIQINDNSTWGFPERTATNTHWRMEAMITFQRLQPTGAGPFTNPIIYSNFQYRNMGHAYHHGRTQNCGFRSATT